MAKTKPKPKPKKKSPRKARPDQVIRPGITLHLTQETIDQACAIVEGGGFRDEARRELGVSKGTWQSWLSRGRAEIAEFEAKKIEDVTLKASLVTQLDAAEVRGSRKLRREGLEGADSRTKLEFHRKRYAKTYARDLLEDDSGDVADASDPVAMLMALVAACRAAGSEQDEERPDP